MGGKLSVLGLILSFPPYLRSSMVRFSLLIFKLLFYVCFTLNSKATFKTLSHESVDLYFFNGLLCFYLIFCSLSCKLGPEKGGAVKTSKSNKTTKTDQNQHDKSSTPEAKQKLDLKCGVSPYHTTLHQTLGYFLYIGPYI